MCSCCCLQLWSSVNVLMSDLSWFDFIWKMNSILKEAGGPFFILSSYWNWSKKKSIGWQNSKVRQSTLFFFWLSDFFAAGVQRTNTRPVNRMNTEWDWLKNEYRAEKDRILNKWTKNQLFGFIVRMWVQLAFARCPFAKKKLLWAHFFVYSFFFD